MTEPDESASLDEDRRELLNAVTRLQFPRHVLTQLVEFKSLVDRLERRAAERDS